MFSYYGKPDRIERFILLPICIILLASMPLILAHAIYKETNGKLQTIELQQCAKNPSPVGTRQIPSIL